MELTLSLWHLIELGTIIVGLTAGWFSLVNRISLVRRDVKHMGLAIDRLPCVTGSVCNFEGEED